ncbi:hypothetical protein MY04_4610 [Flammeovirga sp. MY04]|uniref:hypothetical protein n=1 Tax=Flammeovirga sp. MY04 TaxID=1191459 RepID=UPI00080635CD|nr:hypothetical protein [Flammeovirga sp. MY04]ANQ51945.1 hypothetical protein MY04_4610 [Flammeovirga sp. MY04]
MNITTSPRLNFDGNATLNIATGNNNKYEFLKLFDEDVHQVYTHPRIYIGEEEVENYHIQTDKKGKFVEIKSIKVLTEDYRTWMLTPLGKSDLDQEYHDLYALFIGSDIIHPGYMNYYGDLSFNLLDAKIVSVTNDAQQEYSSIIGKNIAFKNTYLCDVSPELQLITQIFYKSIQIGNDTSATPHKSTTRYLNLFKVYNAQGIQGGAGTFHTQFSFKEDVDNELLRGKTFHLRFTFHQLFEIQYPDYNKLNGSDNPAQIRVTGTIFEVNDDLKTDYFKRILTYKHKNPFNTINELYQKPGASNIPFDISNNQVVIDLLNFLPSKGIPHKPKEEPKEPMSLKGEYKFNGFINLNLGKLFIRFKTDNGEVLELGTLDYENDYNLEKMIQCSGLYQFDFPTSIHPQGGKLQIYIEKDLVFEEQDLYITTDQAGNYTDYSEFGDKFFNNSNSKEGIQLHVYERGIPVQKENAIAGCALSLVGDFHRQVEKATSLPIDLYDNVTFLPKKKAGVLTYIFEPYISIDEVQNEHVYTLFDLVHNYQIVFIKVFKEDPEITQLLESNDQITLEDIKRKVLLPNFTIVPAMLKRYNGIFLKDETWLNPSQVNSLLENYMSPSNFANYNYMPITRDLSHQQYLLLKKYADQLSQQS